MRLQYLGTAAAEGMPAMFCCCEKCKKARELGGKNIRARSQAIIDGRIMIDWPADTFWNGLRFGIDYADISTIIITHNHADHYYEDEFLYRQKGFSCIREDNLLTVYGSEDIEESMKSFAPVEEPYGTAYCKISAFQTFEAESGYYITALPAQHGTPNPYIYLIAHEGKTILYGNDTGLLPKETYAYLKEKHIVLDFISLDCTEGTRTPMAYDAHMNLERCMMTVNEMRKDGILTEQSIVCLNHFSHNGMNVLYEDMVKAVEAYGFLVSYDGMTIEI